MIMVGGKMARVTGNELQRVIQETLAVKGWNLADLQRETKRLDTNRKGVSYATLATWIKPQGRAVPRPENLDLVARALGVDPKTLHDAARAAGGYRTEEAEEVDPALQLFVADAQKMTPAERARLLRIVRNVMDDPDLFPRSRDRGD